MRLALKLYSLAYKAKTTMAANSQPDQSKTRKKFPEESTILKITKF
jgi:hypothetical protein